MLQLTIGARRPTLLRRIWTANSLDLMYVLDEVLLDNALTMLVSIFP